MVENEVVSQFMDDDGGDSLGRVMNQGGRKRKSVGPLTIDPITAFHAANPKFIGCFYPHELFIIRNARRQIILQFRLEEFLAVFLIECSKAFHQRFHAEKIDFIALIRRFKFHLFQHFRKEFIDGILQRFPRNPIGAGNTKGLAVLVEMKADVSHPFIGYDARVDLLAKM